MQKALGTSLKIDSTTVGKLTSIGGVEVSADTIDTTTLDTVDGYRTYIPGMIDGGEVSAEGYLDGIGTNEATLSGLVGGEAKTCEIAFPKGAKWAFSGIVTGFSTNADLEDLVGFSLAIKVSGKPTFTAGAGA